MHSTPPNESRLTVLCETLEVTTKTDRGTVAVEVWQVGNWARRQMAEIMKDQAGMPGTAKAEAVFTEATWRTTIDGEQGKMFHLRASTNPLSHTWRRIILFIRTMLTITNLPSTKPYRNTSPSKSQESESLH
jgi:hypothetical protein